ncbi:MAG TPA: ergothioneine biosynthesis protein EgtB, partial [Terracidiphilus sp.]|nr:ergothioneine biosynthesis protein EgtB [Terracidiphilus sp.]
SDFPWLFNSYYRSFAEFPEKKLRASFSRPGIEEILRYRAHVDEGIERLLDGDQEPEMLKTIELGVNHEEQHQELLLTDILHAFFTNPLRPIYLPEKEIQEDEESRIPGAEVRGAGRPSKNGSSANGSSAHSAKARGSTATPALRFLVFEGGLHEAGNSGEGFCFDNELPRHRVWLEPYSLADRLVTCGEYAEFISDGGYRKPELWLSAGWDAMQQNGWRAPLYWSGESGEWSLFTLRGERSLTDMSAAPVSHLSYFEADAYARWAGGRLPTEFEWEAVAEKLPIEGNLLDSRNLAPCSVEGLGKDGSGMQLFGDCWEWTASAYLGYPGFRPLAGSLGEYNGKFMSGQMVLRGGSCVTPAAHVRASYRNFFAPETRWQFSGIRLASK